MFFRLVRSILAREVKSDLQNENIELEDEPALFW